MKNLMSKVFWASSLLLVASSAFAQEGVATVAPVMGDLALGLRGLGAGLAISIAALGGALAQGRAAATAFDGIARNPAAKEKINTPMILSLVLIESLVIYALIIAFQLAGT